MADLSDVIRAIRPLAEEVSKEFIETFTSTLIDVFRVEGVPLIKTKLLRAYDQLADEEEGQMGARVKGKDPLSLKRVRHLFERQITEELKTSISVVNGELIIQIMDKAKLGFGSEGSAEGAPDTVDFLAVYLEGIIGEFAFITPQQYKNRGRRSSKPLGRLGGGFLMPRDRYESELWAEVTGAAFDEVRHSISGQGPFRGFDIAIKDLDFSSIISNVVTKTVASLDGTSRG